MDTNLLFEKMAEKFNLGNILEQPEKITGGLMHRMFKLTTNKGIYVVKLLNPNVMKRPTAIANYNKADKLEEILKCNNIKAIYSLEFNNKKMQEIDGQYFYIYEWYNGKTLKDSEITQYHCEEIGKVLAKIHNIDLVNTKYLGKEKRINFNYYIDIAEKNNATVYELLYDKLELLNESMNKGNIAIKHLPNFTAICHNDMDPKNVMWLEKDYKIIDLECLDYSNPYLELYELALCWSGYEKCNINFDLFKTFLKAYFDNTKLDKNIDWESIYYANNGRLEWLEFNIKRALMIECDSKEEQELSLNEVRETMEHIIYYEKVKDKILYNIQELIND